MATIDTHLRIRVSSSIVASTTVWAVKVADETHAIFSGEGSKGRAIESALHYADELRLEGTVLVVIEPGDGSEHVSRVILSRLAS